MFELHSIEPSWFVKQTSSTRSSYTDQSMEVCDFPASSFRSLTKSLEQIPEICVQFEFCNSAQSAPPHFATPLSWKPQELESLERSSDASDCRRTLALSVLSELLAVRSGLSGLTNPQNINACLSLMIKDVALRPLLL